MELLDFTQKLGSNQPAPGGGAAGGISLALAAACAQKAMIFSKPESSEQVQSDLESLRLKGHQLCDEDQYTFLAWQKARQLPKATEVEKEFRANEVNRTAAECAAVPLATGNAAILLIQMLEKLLPQCSKFLISDIACSVSFAAAALQTACVNIEINLPYVKDALLLSKMQHFLTDEYCIANKCATLLLEQCRTNICQK